MKNGVVVDASIWVVNLVAGDAFNLTSRNWLQEQHSKEIELISPVLLITEVAGVVRRQTGSAMLAAQAVEMIRALPGVTLVRLSDSLVTRATDLAAELGLRGADSFYVAAADYLGLPLATFDIDQRQRASAILTKIYTPQ